MGQNLTGQTIASTYEDLVQISGSSRNILTDGTGSEITNLAVTASHATSASLAVTASYASTAISSSHAINADNAISASFAQNALSASYAPGIPAFPFTGSAEVSGSVIIKGAGLNLQGGPGIATVTISNATGNGDLLISQNSAILENITLDRFSTLTSTTDIDITGSFRNAAFTNRVSAPSFTGSLFGTASFATTASFALNAGGANTGSLMVTGSVSSNTLTFTKGDGSTFNLIVDTGSAVSTPTGSLMVTGSVNLNTLTFTKGDGSTFALTVDTGSGGGGTTPTGSLLVTASITDATTTYTKGDGSTFALTTNNVQNATSASFATTASFANNVNLGTFASASFTGSTWTFNHNLGRDYVIIDCYDGNNEEIIPQTIDLVTTNQASITFPTSIQGTAIASLGGSTTTNSVTNNTFNNTYINESSINTVSSQVGNFVSGSTQKLTITSTGTYNLHVSASGPHWVDFTGLASGTTANLNIYMWVDNFAALSANSGSMVMFNAAAGTGNYVSYRTIITGSGTYWATNTTIGGTTVSIARNATLARRDFNNSGINPTAIIKTVDGDVILYNPGSPLQTTQYSFTGNQGTPIP